MVEMAFKRFITLLSGTWAMNMYLRALGASVGDWVSFRLGMCLPLCPDQLTIKDGCAAIARSCLPPVQEFCHHTLSTTSCELQLDSFLAQRG